MRALWPGGLGVPAVVGRARGAAHRLLAARVALDRPGPARRVARVAAGSAPWRARSAGRANSWKVTMADTGLPGSPKASVRPPGPSAVPNQVGCPGRRLTPQKRSSTPSAANAPSRGRARQPTRRPTRTPRRPRERARERRAGGAAGRPGRPPPPPPRRPRRWPVRRAPGGWSSRSGLGRAAAPGSASSSPVASTATRGRRAQLTSARPTPAATPSAAGPSGVPARSTVWPARTSSPARRMFAPSGIAGTVTRPSALSVRSTGTTAAAPAGTSGAGRDADGRARLQRAAGRPARARLARRPAARPRPRPAARSRPWPSCRTAARPRGSPRPRPAPVRAREQRHPLGGKGTHRGQHEPAGLLDCHPFAHAPNLLTQPEASGRVHT